MRLTGTGVLGRQSAYDASMSTPTLANSDDFICRHCGARQGGHQTQIALHLQHFSGLNWRDRASSSARSIRNPMVPSSIASINAMEADG
jgi:hypothetical protein